MSNYRVPLWRAAFLACFLTAAPAVLPAQFQSVQTDNMRLIYTSPLQVYLVPQVTASFENALKWHRAHFDWDPGGRINVLMHDLWHLGNAGARPVPENHVTVGISPYGHDYESAPAPERMASSMNHEMVHIVTTDKATASDAFFRRLFQGKVTPNAEVPLSMAFSYLTTPRWYAPRWYLEGIATYLETWMNGGLGRAIGPYDEMVFRTLVKDSLTMYDVVGLESEGTTIDFQVGSNSYLYGTRFVSYLGLRYGHDSLFAWFDRTEGSKRYFAGQFERVYGRPLAEEWSRWIDWEREWQRDNLAAIRRHPVTVARPLTDRVLGSVSRAYFDSTSNSILVAIRYPGQEAHIARIDIATGRFSRVHDIVGATGLSVTSLAFDAASRTLFYTTNNADWRHLLALDLSTGQTRVLLKDARIGDLAFNAADKSLWGVRHDNGFSTLVRIPHPYREWNQVRTLPYGRDLFDLDISPDGASLIGSMSAIGGDQSLVQMNTAAALAKDTTTQVLYEFGDWSPSNFVFSRDGRFLFGSSYFSGVSNIFRYEFAKKAMEALSNAETGYFKPLPIPGDSVIVFAYSGTGFVPSMIPNAVPDSVSAINFLGNEIAERRPEVQEWMPPPVSELGIDAGALDKATVQYRTMRHFKLDNAYPVVEGYEDADGTLAIAGGLRFNFSDRLGATGLELTTSYSPRADLDEDEHFHARAVLRHWNWKVTAALNRADFYDLFGPTLVSRKGHSLALQYSDNLYLDGPTSLGYTVQAAQHGNLAVLPDFQGVGATFDKLTSFSGELAYKSLRKSLGAIEDELGGTWGLAIRGNHVNGRTLPRLSLDLAKGFLLPLDHSSLWLRGAVGKALGGDSDDPFARFYFGGFGNNWVDYRAIKQFRATESFPGLEINEAGGSNFAKAQVEWVLPPLRFRSVGVPSFYLRWASLSLFASGLVTDLPLNPDAGGGNSYKSAGAQLDIRFVTISHLDSTLSLGYAVAQVGSTRQSPVFMFSFKIM